MKVAPLFLALALSLPILAHAQTPNAQWPQLASQLKRVQPGSALEALIRDNQQFDMLRSDEFTSNRTDLPPWIKVLWRKAHPEGTYSADDPSGGYPLVLKEVVEWMEHHQDLVAGTPEPLQMPAPDKASVTGEIKMSGAPGAPRSESDIRVNYWDAQKILSASNNISGSGMQAQFFSTNGGAAWGQSSLPLVVGDAFHSDPTVDWTSDGKAWSTTLGIDSGASVLKLRSYTSVDNGATWVAEATPSGAQTNVDKQMVWVDHNATSPCSNYQYAIYHNGNPAFITTRNATTNTWGAPIQVSGAESTGTAIGSDIKSNSAGDAFGFWPTTTNRRIFMTKSTNCGTSWATPVQVAATLDGYDIGVPSFSSRRALIYVSGGTYRNPTKNMVYASWTDLSGEAGCTAAANEPGTNVASTCKTRIWFARSTDGGTTWLPPAMLNNQASLNDQFNQALVVDETTGALGIIYYDTVADAGRKKVHLYYQSSFNDGATWSAALQVTSLPTDETIAGANSGNQFGDYNSLTGIAGNFFPSWTDRRGGANEEIWTAKINDALCTAPSAPVIGTASATAANQVQVSWTNGAPPATQFNVYRAVGTCAAPGPFTRIASAVAASPYTDNTVSGGTTYAYKVAGTEATGNCESTQSSCLQVTATGACTLAPTFAGLATATNAATASCNTVLAWSAGAPSCAGPVTYSVYRSTSTGFVPGPANLLTSAVAGTGYSDTTGLVSGTPYYYVVRAVDSSNSLADTNTVQRSVTPTGPLVTSNVVETFENASGFDNAGWTHQALSGTVDWTWSTAQSNTPTHSWNSASQTSVSDRVLVSPSFGVVAGTTLSFFHTFAFEGSVSSCFDGGTLEVSTNGGSTWTVMPDANFTAGLFTGTVNSGFSNPLAGKRAWCAGTIGAMTQVNVNLASFAGQTLKVRWHEGDDTSAVASGWFVDSVTINNAGVAGVCTNGPADSVFANGFE